MFQSMKDGDESHFNVSSAIIFLKDQRVSIVEDTKIMTSQVAQDDIQLDKSVSDGTDLQTKEFSDHIKSIDELIILFEKLKLKLGSSSTNAEEKVIRILY